MCLVRPIFEYSDSWWYHFGLKYYDLLVSITFHTLHFQANLMRHTVPNTDLSAHARSVPNGQKWSILLLLNTEWTSSFFKKFFIVATTKPKNTLTAHHQSACSVDHISFHLIVERNLMTWIQSLFGIMRKSNESPASEGAERAEFKVVILGDKG